MIDLRPDHLETVKRILAAHVPECEARAFGSRVTWTAKDYSDLDLVVVGKERLNPECLSRLTEALENSDLPIRVDVLDWHAISEKFRKVIEKQFEVVRKGEKKSREMKGESVRMCPTVEELPDGWQVKRLGSFCTKIGSGATPRGGSEVYLNSRVSHALVRSQHVFDRHFDSAGLAFISEPHARELRNAEVQSGDVLLNITGDGVTFGRSCIVPDRVLPACVNQHVSIIRPDRRECDPGYLLSVLTHPATKGYIESFNSGGSRRAITKGNIESFEIPLPPLPTQRAIAGVLGALDDKIESNRRTSQSLERVARAIFRAWFVDFEPVKAKAAGARSFPGMLQEAFDSLPTRLVASELGPVPEGWLVGKIKDCCTHIQNGGTPRRNEPQFWENGEIPWLTSGEVRQPIITTPDHFITEAGLEKSSAKWVSPLSTVIALYGATAGQVSLVSSRLTTNQAVCALIPKQHHAFFNYLCMRNATTGLESKAVGSAQQNISKGIVEETQIILPPVPHLECFAALVRPLFEHWISNLYQSRTLAALRDYLLPKLLRGELRVAGGEGTTS